MKKSYVQLDGEYLIHLKDWFNCYVKNFIGADDDLTENAILKKEHTEEVCKNIKKIGKSLNLNTEDLIVAEIIALFHDIGRFEQFRVYRTFLDGKSVNHADFGVKILQENKVFDFLENSVKELILSSIKYHNRAFVPEAESSECIFFTKLIRDADKLDIYRVVTNYYAEMERGKRNKSIELDLPDTAEVSERVCGQLLKKSIVDIKNIETLNDFKLLQLGWIFDINFSHTFDVIRSKKYLGLIAETLPRTKQTNKVFEIIYSYLDEKCMKNKANGELLK